MVIARFAPWKMAFLLSGSFALGIFFLWAGYADLQKMRAAHGGLHFLEAMFFIGAGALTFAGFIALIIALLTNRGRSVWLEGDILNFYTQNSLFLCKLRRQDIIDIRPGRDSIITMPGPNINLRTIVVVTKDASPFFRIWTLSEPRDVILARLRQAVGLSPAVLESDHSAVSLLRSVVRHMSILRVSAAIAAIAALMALLESLLPPTAMTLWVSLASALIGLFAMVYFKSPNFFPHGVPAYKPEVRKRVFWFGCRVLVYAAIWFISAGIIFGTGRIAGPVGTRDGIIVALPAIILFVAGSALMNSAMLLRRNPPD